MASDRDTHRRCVAFPQASAPLNIGEEECHHTRRERYFQQCFHGLVRQSESRTRPGAAATPTTRDLNPSSAREVASTTSLAAGQRIHQHAAQMVSWSQIEYPRPPQLTATHVCRPPGITPIAAKLSTTDVGPFPHSWDTQVIITGSQTTGQRSGSVVISRAAEV